jgi:sugar lactone lactonase YvrE
MDVAGTTLYVADAKSGSVGMFDTETGEAKGEFSVAFPTAVAVDAIGQIWVAYDHGTIQAFRSDGYGGVTYAWPGEVAGMAFGPGGKLYVADAKGGRVLTPGNAESASGFVEVLRLGGEVRALAVDAEGNVVTLDRGGRLAKWSATARLVWERRVND